MIPLLDEAIEAQERAVRDRPKDRYYQQCLCNHYSLRAEARVRMGEHASILPTASVVRDRFPQQVSGLWWASLLARCIPLVEQDSHLEPDERTRLAGKYAEEAMRCLERVRKNSTDFSRIDTHPDFAPLRSRPDFQKRLGTVPKTDK
jgi:hypothetical protein